MMVDFDDYLNLINLHELISYGTQPYVKLLVCPVSFLKLHIVGPEERGKDFLVGKGACEI